MKFAAALLILVSLVASATAHIALLYPTPRGGYGTKAYNGRVHTWIGYKDKTWTQRFPCGGYPPGPVTRMKAGQVIPVRFLASSMKAKDIKSQPKLTSPNRQFSQARHGGGTCEFSLSYDGGKTYRLIGRYTRSCPDAYYEWPVRIPKNVPSCTKKNQCLFVWSWTANILAQYYHNCADIYLTGVKGGKLPKEGISIVDFKPYKMRVTAPGDGSKHKAGPGPTKKQINDNMNGRY
ncbi:hypothetical protein BX616_001323 [Lobosporangium transversale]|uniref:Chitin-binding type-4 domain-containing protein n=1 Tax=Lobosporangium transversale TaxID=64571 RepID=A0A1Y2G905_9FUNG|nr:hypothetical protein BCR41DRAFT_426600 [Lobosporangium transversale]KAF9917336.1 hypothetical protein BX616_001323 [Lobosporangium transversale]ORY98267.1 hypothetical protein BCR41DRAFT_426600 [Lobosporangium transversale]|eukprot:XP_021875696.1 hypothetical protein BCR41DRAFT_426600 [Lobosporangium transversale]